MNTPLNQSRCHSHKVEIPAGFCRKLSDSLIALKEQLHAKFDRALPGRRHLVRELIADAEARAWETAFPHLFLPDFAELRFAEVLASEQPGYAHAA